MVAITFLDAKRHAHEAVPIAEAKFLDFVGFSSVRMIPAHKGQKHLPGYYWFSSLNQLVPYESRLEMFSLMDFDFAGVTIDILPQPLILHFTHKDKPIRHIPDFLVWREGGTMALVDVKPREQAAWEKNKQVFGWTEDACARLGWHYELRNELEAVYLTNLKWFAGYRRRPPQLDIYAASFIDACTEGPACVRDLVMRAELPVLARPALFHLLWKQLLKTDMTILLNDQSPVYLPTKG